MTTPSKKDLDKKAHALIDPLWYGAKSVTLTTKELQCVLLNYGADHLHMHAGIAYDLKHTRIGPGIYSLRLEPKP